jgi:chromosome partitioning protein
MTDTERTPRIIAFTNQSGGAGKSTSAVNLGATLALYGHKVLIIDTDAQCDASAAVGYDEPDLIPDQPNLNDVIIGAAKIEDAIVQAMAGPVGGDETVPIENLDIVLGSIELEAAEQNLATRMGRELWLQEALEPVHDQYDVILIDCPGNLGLVVIGAIVACDEVIACVKPSWKELRALTRIEQTVSRIQTTFAANGAHARLAGVLVVDAPTSRSQGAIYDDAKALAQETYGDLVLPFIRRSPRVPESYAAQMPLAFFDRVAEVTTEYYDVAKALGFRRRK